MKEIIEKAVRGGYKIFWESYGDWYYTYDGIVSDGFGDIQNEAIFFSYEFLKAYFGEEKIEINYPTIKFPVNTRGAISWQYHGQQLVLSDDRIEYLREYL